MNANLQSFTRLNDLSTEELERRAAAATPETLRAMLDEAATLARSLQGKAELLEDEEAAREYRMMRGVLAEFLIIHERLCWRGGEPSRPLASDISDDTIPF